MGKPVIRMGDPTTHGGLVSEGDESLLVDGKPIAGVGHIVYCPQCKGSFPIVQGMSKFSIMGKDVAVQGMQTACGAGLMATQTTLIIDDIVSPNLPYDEQVRLKDEEGNPLVFQVVRLFLMEEMFTLIFKRQLLQEHR